MELILAIAALCQVTSADVARTALLAQNQCQSYYTRCLESKVKGFLYTEKPTTEQILAIAQCIKEKK